MFKRFDRLSKFLYLGTIIPLLAALLTPFLVRSEFLFPFITTKTLFFRILIEVAIFFYILLVLREPKYRPRLTPLVKVVLLFAGVITIASLLGVDLYRSFWGNIERGEGLLTLYHLFAFFLMLPQVIRGERQWRWVFHWLVFISAVLSVYALLQLFGADFVVHSGENRLASTIGNSSFFAGFLIFGVFIAAYLWKKPPLSPAGASGRRGGMAGRIYYALIILLQLFVLFRTETRGSFLGLVGGILLALLISVILTRQRRTRKYALASIAVIIFLGLGIWLGRESILVQNVGLLRRLSTISVTDITTESRLLTWDSSWQGFKERPITGYGWENYNVAFNKHFHAEIFRDRGSQIWFDRAHNIIFDILVTGGAMGLLAYAAIFVAAWRAIYGRFQQDKDLSAFAIFAGLLAAYILQNLFVFDVLAVYISFYVVLAYIASAEQVVRPDQAARVVGNGLKPFPTPARPFLLAGSAVVLATLTVAAVLQFNVRPAAANLKSVKALILQAQAARESSNQGAALYSQAADTFKEAIAKNTNQTVEIRQKFAELSLNRGRAKPFGNLTGSIYVDTIEEMKQSIWEHPLDAQNYLFLMILYNASDQFDSSRLEQSIKVGQRALELSPTRPQIYFELGQAYLSKRNIADGVAAFEKAVELQPEALESRWNLALAYAFADNQERLSSELTWLSDSGFKIESVQNLRRLGAVYFEAGNFERLVGVYERLVEVDTDDANNWLGLADIYNRLGLIESAREAATRALALEPGLTGHELIQVLLGGQ